MLLKLTLFKFLHVQVTVGLLLTKLTLLKFLHVQVAVGLLLTVLILSRLLYAYLRGCDRDDLLALLDECEFIELFSKLGLVMLVHIVCTVLAIGWA